MAVICLPDRGRDNHNMQIPHPEKANWNVHELYQEQIHNERDNNPEVNQAYVEIPR